MKIDAKGIYYRELNQKIRAAVASGADKIDLVNVNGQYFIGDGLNKPVTITVNGVPGNDLAAFNNGATIIVKENGQDNIGNTMNAGKVIVHGHAGDVLGYGMRGGRVHILKDVGYRVGIHMKSYNDNKPVLIAGGKAGDFFGEYMAGGVLVLLGMRTQFPEQPLVGGFCGSGMHGGTIFLRGEVEPWQVGKECGIFTADEADMAGLRPVLEEWCEAFGHSIDEVLSVPFTKLVPVSHRPYGKLYANM